MSKTEYKSTNQLMQTFTEIMELIFWKIAKTAVD